MAQAPPLRVRPLIIACVFTLLLPSLISADDFDFSVQLCLPCLAGLTLIERALQIILVQCEVDWVTPTGQIVSVDTEGCLKVKSSSKGEKGLSIKCSLEISILKVGKAHTSIQRTLSFAPDASSHKYVAVLDSDKELELYLKRAIEKGAKKGAQILEGTFNKAKRDVEKGAKKVEKEAKKGAQVVEGTFNKAKNILKKFHH